jgi:hypothetical protein
MLKARLIGIVVGAAALMAVMAPSASASSVGSPSVSFYRNGAPGGPPKAGESRAYDVDFYATNGVGATDSFTLTGPVGTVWPDQYGGYQINIVNGPGCSYGTVTRSNSNRTVTITNPYCPGGNGTHFELYIGSSTGVQTATTAGSTSLSVSTTDDTTPAAANFTILPNDPAQVSVTGDGQSTEVNTAFANPVVAHVADTYGNAISGKTVTFDAPDAGASGTFADDTVDTDASGNASASVTASTTAGLWNGTASVTGGSNPSDGFQMTNDPGAVADVDVQLTPSTIEANGIDTSTATATLTDSYSNPILGDSVAFTSSDTGQGISATTDNGDGTYSALITASATPGQPTITATDSSVVPDAIGTAQLTQTQDLSQPGVQIDSGPPKKTKAKKVTFEFSSAAPDLASFECKLDKKDFAPCTSPATYRVKKGRHTFQVRALDYAGNTGEPAVSKFKRV